MDWGGGAGQAIPAIVQQIGDAQAQGIRARGQIIGNSLSALGNLIAQAPERKLQQQEITARTQALQGQAADRQLKVQQYADLQAQHQALQAALADPSNLDEAGKVDPRKVAGDQRVAAFPAVAAEYHKMAGEQSTADIHAQELAAAKKKADDLENDSIAAQIQGVTDYQQLAPRLDALNRMKVDPQKLQALGAAADKAQQSGAPVSDFVQSTLQASPTYVEQQRKLEQSRAKGEGQHVVNGQVVGPDGVPIGAAVPPQAPAVNPETVRHDQATEAIAKMTAGREAAQAAETARHNKATEAANNPLAALSGGGGGGTPAAGGAPANPTGADALANVPPQIASQVKALAEGRMQFPSGFALKSPYWQSMLGLVSQYDPSFDAVNYNARNSTRKDFTAGKSAQSVNALNTVAGHLAELSDKADQLGNGSTQFVNSVKNWMSRQSGSPTVTNFETAKGAVADELTRVYRQAGGSEADIKNWEATLNAANSPAQLHGAFATISDLLDSKLSALQNQYDQGMGTSDVKMVTAKARAALDKLAGRKPSPEVPAGAGAAPAVGQKVGRFEIVGVK